MTPKQRYVAGLTQNPMWCLESPMERVPYDEFKSFGLTPLMQFPVGKYFLDFAFPEAQIGVEYDGKIHQGRELYDRNRDQELSSLGWTIYRLNAFHLKRIRFDEDLDEMVPERLMQFMYGLRDVLKNYRRVGSFQSIGDVFLDQIEGGTVGSIKLLNNL